MARIDDTEAAEIADARLHLDAARQPRELADKRRAFLRALCSDSNPSIVAAAEAELAERRSEWATLTEAHEQASRTYTETHMRIRRARYRRAKRS